MYQSFKFPSQYLNFHSIRERIVLAKKYKKGLTLKLTHGTVISVAKIALEISGKNIRKNLLTYLIEMC
ncbi:hypothetical protein A21D_02402 [Virgibacillus dokdonensis]|uniref:Uncharacterized protein n=1 Tax=Virgibacillus dokdonensis TaxID=302167 RepID=A0A2K9J0M7_9BACI|nr:hypothetical protein A21D_02402 [Virgibacillus dokdonensis]